MYINGTVFYEPKYYQDIYPTYTLFLLDVLVIVYEIEYFVHARVFFILFIKDVS